MLGPVPVKWRQWRSVKTEWLHRVDGDCTARAGTVGSGLQCIPLYQRLLHGVISPHQMSRDVTVLMCSCWKPLENDGELIDVLCRFDISAWQCVYVCCVGWYLSLVPREESNNILQNECDSVCMSVVLVGISVLCLVKKATTFCRMSVTVVYFLCATVLQFEATLCSA